MPPKKESLYASKDKIKHFKKELKGGLPFDIPIAPSDTPEWFQKAVKGIFASGKKKNKQLSDLDRSRTNGPLSKRR